MRYIHSGVDGFSIAGDSEAIVERAADVIKGICSVERAPEDDVAAPTLRHSIDTRLHRHSSAVNGPVFFGTTSEDYELRQSTQDFESSHSQVTTAPSSPVITPRHRPLIIPPYASVAPLTHANQEFGTNPASLKGTDTLRYHVGAPDRCEAGAFMELSSPGVLLTPFPLLLEVMSESPSTTPRQTTPTQDVRNGNSVWQQSEAMEYSRRVGQIAIANQEGSL